MAKYLILLRVAAMAWGVIFLANSDMPTPSAKIEKVIPNERFN